MILNRTKIIGTKIRYNLLKIVVISYKDEYFYAKPFGIHLNSFTLAPSLNKYL